MTAVADEIHASREPWEQRLVDRVLDWGLYIALAAMILFFSLASPYFLTLPNLLNIGEAMAVTGIIAAGLTIVLIAGQLDLTVGAMIGFSSTIIAILLERARLPPLGVVAAVFAVALLVGLFNGSLVVDFGINSIIATLAMSTVVRGLAFITVTGQTLPITSPDLQRVVNARPWGIPTPLLVMLLVYLLAFLLLTYFRFGYHIYATGGNREAARRAGIATDRVIRLVFLISATLAVVGGIITTGRNASGQAVFGMGAELDILTAVLLGGIGLSGGAGRVERTLVGVLFIGILNNGLILLNVPSYYQFLARGAAFLLAVLLDALRAKRARR